MMQSIFMTGLGGQGIITLANLISGQATKEGLKVTLFNAKGMAQRGGRVTSEIRMSDDPQAAFFVGNVGVVSRDVNAICPARGVEKANLNRVSLVRNGDDPQTLRPSGNVGVVPDDVNTPHDAA